MRLIRFTTDSRRRRDGHIHFTYVCIPIRRPIASVRPAAHLPPSSYSYVFEPYTLLRLDPKCT